MCTTRSGPWRLIGVGPTGCRVVARLLESGMRPTSPFLVGADPTLTVPAGCGRWGTPDKTPRSAFLFFRIGRASGNLPALQHAEGRTVAGMVAARPDVV